MFAFIKPDSLEYIGLKWLDIILILVDGITMFSMILLLFSKKYRISRSSITIFVIYLFIGIFTILGTQDYFSFLKVAGTSFGFSLFADYMIQRRIDIFFKAAIATLIILFSINLITIIKYFPNGMYQMDKIVGDLYFMGHDNGMIYNLIPLCSLSLLYSYLKKEKMITWYSVISLFLLFSSEVYVQSATGIIESILLVLLIFGYDNKILRKLINPVFLFTVYFISNILIVLIRIQNNFSWIIVGIFKKDITFTGRTYLWDYTILKIIENHFMGCGMGTVIPGANGHTYPHCHNLLLDFLYKGGIFSLVFFIILIILFKLHIENAYFLLLYVILQVFTALFLQFVRGLGESVKYTVASFISATTTTILNVIALVILKMGLQGLFVSTLSAQIVTLIYLIFASKCWEYISPKNIHLSIFKSVGTYSIPLIPNNLAWWVVNASDRTIIAHFLTTAANGIYSVANKFPNVFISFYNILNLSWTETVSLHYGDEDRDEFLTETMTSLFKLFAAACFGIVACMPFVFPIMVNLKYSAAYNQILILMYAMLFRVLVGLYSCVYVAQKNAKKIAYTSISAAIINIAVDLILINKIQVFAASLSTLIAFLSMFIVRYIDVNKTVHMKIRKPIIIGSVLIGGMLIGTYYCENRMIQFAALCITAVYAVLTNVDMLKSGVNLVKSRLGK